MGSGEDGGVESRSRPSGTVAFVFIDIEGSTAAWDAEPDAMGVAVRRLEDLLDAVAAGTSGRRAVEQGAGDSAVLAFDRPSDAALAALRLQLKIAAESWPTSAPLRVRAALHLGEVDVGADGTYRGPTMNRCGRLLSSAHGGQVVASGSFVAVLGESASNGDGELAEAGWVDLGAHTLRGIPAPVRIWQLVHPALESDFAPLRTLEGRGLDLPGWSSNLVGRSAELARLDDLLASSRVVTVLGPGGSGKTRLAVEAAHRSLDDHDSVEWIDLAKVAHRDGVDDLVVSELSIHAGPRAPRQRIVEHLRARRALVVLDNCEHVLHAAGSLVEDVVASCSGVTVLTTSREPLELGSEALLRLGPLTVPMDAEGVDLFDCDAGILFGERVARVREGGIDSAEDRAAAAEICRRLDGIPLALELAAARARSMPLTVVAERLERRFALLVGGTQTALARQRTLEASVAWSYDLLDPVEQSAVRQLSQFSGPFDLVDAMAFLDVAEPDPRDVVASLVDRSLLLEERDATTARYRMLETVRFFARDRALQADESATLRDRHLAWVSDVVRSESATFEQAGAAAALLRLDRIVEEIRAALDWAASTDRPADALEILTDLMWYWVWRGMAGDALRRYEELGPLDGIVDDHLLARAGFARFKVQSHALPDHDALEACAAATLDEAIRVGDTAVEGRLRLLLATHRGFRDPVGQRSDLDAAADLCREHGGPFWSAMADCHVSQSLLFQVRLLDAQVPVAATERAAAASGIRQLVVESIGRRATIAFGLGDHDGALQALADVDAALEGVDSREMRAMTLAAATWVHVHRGDVEGVIARTSREIDDYVRDEDLQFVPLLLAPLAAARIAAGQAAVACEELAVVWNHPEVQAAKVYGFVLVPVYAAALRAAGKATDARTLVLDGLQIAAGLESDAFAAQLALLLGAFDLDDGDPASAEPRLHDALDALHRAGHRQDVCDALEELAHLELDFARPAAAAVLLGAAAAERDAQRVVLRPWRQTAFDDTVARTRSELGDDEMEERWARGAALTLDEAVALARRGRGERVRPTFGWDGLTDTERRVAQLAADGLTNPQIADHLVVGRETVKSHMASILRKLGVRNRTELARLVASLHAGP